MPIGQIGLRCEKPKWLDYPTDPRTLGGYLKKRRMDLGLFQKDVAQRIGCCVASIWLWENGTTEPELKWLPAILAWLGYDPRPEGRTIGEKLVRFRTGRGWSQQRLAAELSVDPSTLSRWELGKKSPWGVYADRVMKLLRLEGADSPSTKCS